MFGIIILCSQCPLVRQMFIVIRLADKHVTVAIKWHGTYPPQKRLVVGFVQTGERSIRIPQIPACLRVFNIKTVFGLRFERIGLIYRQVEMQNSFGFRACL